MKLPIVLIAFDRPNYFEQCCEALSLQADGRDVYLFQDSPWHMSQVDNTNNNVSVFRKYFPSGRLYVSESNLGVGFNTKAARETIFKSHDAAVFIEDDLVLSPWYMEMMDEFEQQFRDDPRIGMVNGYCGAVMRTDNTIERQRINKNKFVRMDHTLAPIMWANKYEKITSTLYEYYDLIKGRDYRLRDHQRIWQFWANKGIPSNKIVTSQDCATVLSMLMNNQIKISTATNNLLYIGEYGVHSNPHAYNEYGWDRFPVYPEKTSGYKITEDEIIEITFQLKKEYGIIK